MIDEDFQSLRRGLAEIASYKAGERKGYLSHEPVDVKAVRAATKKSQTLFANSYHIPVGTLKDWEQGRRQPDAPARALLTLIAKDPVAVEKMLAG